MSDALASGGAGRDPGPLVCERKYVGSAAMHEAALALLRLHCLPDPAHPSGWIESLYFDNAISSSHAEKENGDALKRKVRIRWYPQESAQPESRMQAFLEVKDRLCAARTKVHRAFFADGRLLQSSPLKERPLIALLREQLLAAGLPVWLGLRPALSIRYHRHRFVCPLTQSRICLDSALSSPRVNPGLLPAGPPLRFDRIVCEAKSGHVRSWPWSASLCRLGFRMRSFSKYGEFMDIRLNRGE